MVYSDLSVNRLFLVRPEFIYDNCLQLLTWIHGRKLCPWYGRSHPDNGTLMYSRRTQTSTSMESTWNCPSGTQQARKTSTASARSHTTIPKP